MNAVGSPVASQARREEQQLRCRLCSGPARRTFVATDLNRAASRERFEYARCLACRTYFIVHPPEDMAPYYPNEYYELPSAEVLAAAARSEQFKIRMLLDHTTLGRLVEIGPGVGAFARAAHDAGFEVTGIDMNHRACEYLREEVGVEAIASATPEDVLLTLPPSRAIVLWHVIEHLPNPGSVIERAARNLGDGGVLAIAAPNPKALQFKLLRRRWAHLDAPRHWFLIPPETLANRCLMSGLQLAFTTTADPAGRYWNAFGWDYALRRSPRSQVGTRTASGLARWIARALAPIETRGENGCAYTSIFVKPGRNDP